MFYYQEYMSLETNKALRVQLVYRMVSLVSTYLALMLKRERGSVAMRVTVDIFANE